MSNWFHLPHLSGLSLSGRDALAFAHSQFTSEIEPAEPAVWKLTSWCNAKGRVLNVILARAHEDRVDLVVPAAQLAEFARKLKMYSIGRELVFAELPPLAGSFMAPGSASPLALDPQRWLDAGRSTISADPAALKEWQLRDVRSGIAWLTDSSSGRFLPQALGLEERGGLSYRKGCYPGQEVIARVHYLGRAKERLAAFRAAAAEACTDQPIIDANGSTVGHVLTLLVEEDRALGLAVVSADLPDTEALTLGSIGLRLIPPASL